MREDNLFIWARRSGRGARQLNNCITDAVHSPPAWYRKHVPPISLISRALFHVSLPAPKENAFHEIDRTFRRAIPLTKIDAHRTELPAAYEMEQTDQFIYSVLAH